jgi:choline dehydrogenase-like flavoprotein
MLPPITAQELRLQAFLRVLAVVFALAALGYLLPALFGDNKASFIHLPFVTNSAVKVSVMALLCFFAAADVRPYRLLAWLVIVGHLISELAVTATLIWGETARTLTLALPFVADPITVQSRDILVGSMVLDGVIIVLLVWFYRTAQTSAYQLTYLSPMEFRSLEALSEALIEGEKDAEVVQPEEMARNGDRYLGLFRAQTKWIFKVVLNAMQIYPLLSLRPPLSMMDTPSRRAFLEQRFYRNAGVLPQFWRTMVKVMIRISKQLAYLAYYNDERTFEQVGYTRFRERPHGVGVVPDARKPLRVTFPSQVDSETLTADVVIVGSGAGASILAESILRENPNRSITMLERGDYVDRQEMNDDEIDMLSRLYSEGALQLSRDFGFQVLQGKRVGGTTVVNNAICFDLPGDVLDRWNDPHGFDAALDPGALAAAHLRVRDSIGVRRQDYLNTIPGHDPLRRNLNPGGAPFMEGIKKLGLDANPNDVQVVEANIDGCHGCGYCNIGCQYGKKMSMLDTVLPRLQEKYGERLKIISGCEVTKLGGGGTRVKSAECRLANGRRLTVKATTFVVSAGAVSSSLLLLRSGIGGARTGKGLSFNLGSPMSAVFDRVVNAYDGLQISHYIRQNPSRGFIAEIWFNPPVAQALTMPGWFSDHFNNMRRYNRMASVGVLVGTEANASVRNAGIFGRDIDYTPKKSDLDKLADGLITAGEIFLAGGAGSVMPHTLDFYEWSDKRDLERLRSIVTTPGALTLGTGHPQGGNAISAHASRGVVSPEFRVHGYDNLFVADASVFPTSIGVNPQLTVMALADYAGPFVASSNGHAHGGNGHG